MAYLWSVTFRVRDSDYPDKEYPSKTWKIATKTTDANDMLLLLSDEQERIEKTINSKQRVYKVDKVEYMGPVRILNIQEA